MSLPLCCILDKWPCCSCLPKALQLSNTFTLLGLRSETKPKWVEPPTLQVDLSKLSNPNFSYLGFPNDYTVYVTALVGSNKSNSTPQQGISFSYYQNSLTHHKCESRSWLFTCLTRMCDPKPGSGKLQHVGHIGPLELFNLVRPLWNCIYS